MVTRRDFLRMTGAAAGTAAAATIGVESASASHLELDEERFGVLSDFTQCIGCRRCEYACAEQNGLPHGELKEYDDQSVFEGMRRPTENALTVVNRYEPRDDRTLPLTTKIQCMHCEHPPCVSACPVSALEKNPLGPVTYDASRCIGCRYCMVACPFQIPAYEYHNPLTPEVVKCTMCQERTLEQGLAPACVDMCPVEALTFGRRSDLIDIAHERMRQNPGRYYDKVYGETDGGGTSWLMLADRDFEELDLPRLSVDSPADPTESLQHGIFKGFSGPIMLMGLLGILMKSSSDARKYDQEDNHE
ncbi:4Fe-4S dicluster domain-containing protein [bacterium]|nr:MAG: 4Fe-4S dicluster domain-containing protein [bacterium]